MNIISNWSNKWGILLKPNTEVLMVQWLGALAHSRKVAGSIPAHAIGLFRWNLQQIP